MQQVMQLDYIRNVMSPLVHSHPISLLSRDQFGWNHAKIFSSTKQFNIAYYSSEFLGNHCNKTQLICWAKIGGRKRWKGLMIGYKWRDVTLPEVFTFMCILINGMLYPQTVCHMLDWWDSPYKHAWTKFISKGGFKQFVLCFTSVIIVAMNGWETIQ